jgi:hypothetical protein
VLTEINGNALKSSDDESARNQPLELDAQGEAGRHRRGELSP